MDKYSQIEQAKNQGYIIGSSPTIDLLQNEFYEWCKELGKPYITITTRNKYCSFDVDTPSPNLKLNQKGVTAMKDLIRQHIDTDGTCSIGEESIFHDNVRIETSEKLAKGTLNVFEDKDNIESKI
jgi:hypothetical protein